MNTTQLKQEYQAGLDPWDRYRKWLFVEALPLDFPYVQPALSVGGSPVDYLDLFCFPKGRRSVPSTIIKQHLRAFVSLSVLKGRDARLDPAFGQIMRYLDDRDEISFAWPMLNRASATPKPTLFVEGDTDAKIVKAAWTVFFPNERMPVKVISAGGIAEMDCFAGKGTGKGKALKELLGDQVVLVLADNDSSGRRLPGDGRVRKGGTWRQLRNGIYWCLLKPTAAFAAAMTAYNVPTDYWPFTIEAAFPPALRRRAEAAGAWRFAGTPQAELLDNPDLARRLFTLLPKLRANDDAWWYLMAPHSEVKETFASWITAPERCTEENYAAFEEIIRGLRDVLIGIGWGPARETAI